MPGLRAEQEALTLVRFYSTPQISKESLESAINRLGTTRSLPVVTIADPDRLMSDHDYAERAAVQLLEFLLDLDNLRGAGRLYIP